ncbi:MAG: hypothetical protein ACKVZJ_14650 [Phycisphaerales bacterium]
MSKSDSHEKAGFARVRRILTEPDPQHAPWCQLSVRRFWCVEGLFAAAFVFLALALGLGYLWLIRQEMHGPQDFWARFWIAAAGTALALAVLSGVVSALMHWPVRHRRDAPTSEHPTR